MQQKEEDCVPRHPRDWTGRVSLEAGFPVEELRFESDMLSLKPAIQQVCHLSLCSRRRRRCQRQSSLHPKSLPCSRYRNLRLSRRQSRRSLRL